MRDWTPLSLPIPGQPLFNSEPLGWDSIFAQRSVLQASREVIDFPEAADDTISLLIDGAARVTELGSSYVVVSPHSSRGSIAIQPRRMGLRGMVESETGYTILFLRIKRRLIDTLVDGHGSGDPEHIELRPIGIFHDPLIYYLGLELNRELEAGSPGGEQFVESVAQTLTLHLLRCYSNSRPIHDLPSKGLTFQQRAQVESYIHEHLGDLRSTEELAQILHISSTHLRRQFQIATGLPLWQHVIQLRIERARDLIQQGRLSLREIASEVGFADQSHLNRHFKRIYGVSPRHLLRH